MILPAPEVSRVTKGFKSTSILSSVVLIAEIFKFMGYWTMTGLRDLALTLWKQEESLDSQLCATKGRTIEKSKIKIKEKKRKQKNTDSEMVQNAYLIISSRNQNGKMGVYF